MEKPRNPSRDYGVWISFIWPAISRPVFWPRQHFPCPPLVKESRVTYYVHLPHFGALYRDKCYNSSRSVTDLLNLINNIWQNQALSTQKKKRKFKSAAGNTAPFLYFKFIAQAIDAFHIIRQVRGNPELLSQVAYMIVDRFPGIVGVILMPYQIQEHFISEHPFWIQYEQSKDFKFLDRQRNYLAPHGNKALLQAEI